MRLATIIRYARPRIAAQSRAGWCPVCGRRTVFVVVHPERIREDARCLWCRSLARNRYVALCAVECFAGRGIRSLKDFACVADLRVYNLAAQGCFVRVWGEAPNITCSEHLERGLSGEVCDRVLCQDVERLSFPDESFDLVLSEEVFEHVRDWRRGMREVLRVLRPGGHHVFSVPLHLNEPTRDRFARGDGDVCLLPAEYHGDPIRGRSVVQTSFGYDAGALVAELGFEVRLRIASYAEQVRYGVFGSYTFIARKPGGN